MIIKFKIFESDSNAPKIGDYIVCEDLSASNHSGTGYKLFSEFIVTNVGQIVRTSETHEFFVIYNNVPEIYDILDYAFYTPDRTIIKGLKYKKIKVDNKIYTNITSIRRKEIIFFSNDKKTVENFIETRENANKYNL
jgi:hypothetical protein